MDSYKGKISVIIPVYNVCNYLDRCIQSVLTQTYKDLEIILVDDGSTDESGKLCDIYKERDERIIVIHQKNQGVSCARNAGINIASGEYIGFVDADDYIEKNMYEELSSKIYFGNVKNEIIVCSFNRINNNEKRVFTYRINDGVYSNNVLIRQLLEPDGIDGFSFIKLFNKEVIINNKIQFASDITYMEDVLFTYKFLLFAKKGYIMSTPLYNYCINENSVTQKKVFPKGTLKVFDRMLDLTRDKKDSLLIKKWRNAIITIQVAKSRSIAQYSLPDDFPDEKQQKKAIACFLFDNHRSIFKRLYYLLLVCFPRIKIFLDKIKKL